MNSVILLTKFLSSVFDAKYIAKDIPDEELKDAFYKGNLEIKKLKSTQNKYDSKAITLIKVINNGLPFCEITDDGTLYGEFVYVYNNSQWFCCRRNKYFTKDNITNKSYKTLRYYVVPEIKAKKLTKENKSPLEYISDKYFNGEKLYLVTLTQYSTGNLDVSSNNYVTGAFVRESDLVEYTVKPNKKKLAEQKMLDTIFKPVLNNLLNKYNIQTLNKSYGEEYIWYYNELLKFAEAVFLEKVIPELESAGLVINSKTKYTFNRITRDYVVLFNKKNLKLKV